MALKEVPNEDVVARSITIGFPKSTGSMTLPGGMVILLYSGYPNWFHRWTMRLVFGFTFHRAR